MSSSVVPVLAYSDSDAEDSDYGSDFSPEELEILDKLLAATPSNSVPAEDNPIVSDVEYHLPPAVARITRFSARESRRGDSVPIEYETARHSNAESVQSNARIGINLNPVYPDLSSALSSLDATPAAPEPAPDPNKPDTRSPLERFRTAPRKALSVTDMVSPAWCELQYWFTLTVHGKKIRTEAMKRGSAVHQQLEDQIYTTVKVDIQTKEDAWGLRIWNVIQGLQTLQETGRTRELEVWGVIDGQVINGVIDEVSFTCPDTELEEQAGRSKGKAAAAKPSKPPTDAMPDQKTLSEYFKDTGSATLAQTIDKSVRRARRSKSPSPSRTSKLYVCDVKTRSVSSLPRGAAFRPTKLQLMLYHHLLSRLASNEVDFDAIAQRHGLDTSAPFSDSFLAQVGSLNDEVFYDASSTPSSAPSPTDAQDSMAVLLAHNSLAALWGLMMARFQAVAPRGRDSIGRILRAEYRSRGTGEVIGNHTFVTDEGVLEMYVSHEMEWWKGQREAQGVVVDEAYKCRSCEYAEGCEWRLGQVEEARERARRGWAG